MEDFILKAVMVLVPMILCLAVHEYSHAIVAQALGDDTARLQGRVTLNPISHIDPIGTLVLPLFSVAFNAPFFGWAKPVPYNPLRFRRTIPMRWGTVLVAAAGPISNIIFALLCTAALGIWYHYSPGDFASTAARMQNPGVTLLAHTMFVNVILFFFNMVPIPPLDGSRVLANILPHRFAPIFEAFERYSFILFIVLLVSGGFRFIAYPAVVIARTLLEGAGVQSIRLF